MACRKNKEQFKAESILVHGDIFGFDDYYPETVRHKSKLKCYRSGEYFYASPDNLIRNKRGCSCCRGKKISEALTMNFEDAYLSINTIHPKLHIQKHSYKSFDTPCEILCDIHGIFTRKPNEIKYTKHGCTQCAEDVGIITSRRLTQEEFLAKAHKVNPNLDFTGTVYTRMDEHLTYRCTKHNKTINNRAGNLLYANATGCTECSREQCVHKLHGKYNSTILERDVDKYKDIPCNVYVIRMFGLGETIYKIGLAKDIEDRMGALRRQTGSTELVYKFSSNIYDSYYLEKSLHDLYKDSRFIPEVKFKGWTELFTLSSEMLKEVESIMEVGYID